MAESPTYQNVETETGPSESFRARRDEKLNRILNRDRVQAVRHDVAPDGTVTGRWLMSPGMRVSVARILRIYHIRLEVAETVERDGETLIAADLIDEL